MVDACQVMAGLIYLVAYVALDRVSFSESYAQHLIAGELVTERRRMELQLQMQRLDDCSA